MACCCDASKPLCEGFVCDYDQIVIQPTVVINTDYSNNSEGTWESCLHGDVQFTRANRSSSQILSVSLIITCNVTRDSDGNATGFALEYEGSDPFASGEVTPYSVALEGESSFDKHLCCGAAGNRKEEGFSVLQKDYYNTNGFYMPYGLGSISCTGQEVYYSEIFGALPCIPPGCWMYITLSFRIYGKWHEEWTASTGDYADCSDCPPVGPPSGSDHLEGGNSGQMNGGGGQPVSLSFFCRIPGNNIDNAIDNCLELGSANRYYERLTPFPGANMQWGDGSINYSGCAQYYEGWGWDCVDPASASCHDEQGDCFMCECIDEVAPGAMQSLSANHSYSWVCSCDEPNSNDCCGIDAGEQVSGPSNISRKITHRRYIDFAFLGGI